MYISVITAPTKTPDNVFDLFKISSWSDVDDCPSIIDVSSFGMKFLENFTQKNDKIMIVRILIPSIKSQLRMFAPILFEISINGSMLFPRTELISTKAIKLIKIPDKTLKYLPSIDRNPDVYISIVLSISCFVIIVNLLFSLLLMNAFSKSHKIIEKIIINIAKKPPSVIQYRNVSFSGFPSRFLRNVFNLYEPFFHRVI